MRLLVLSDSHGRKSNLLKIVELHPEADAVIFLGDGEGDIDYVKELCPDRKYYCVAGNCDRGSPLATFRLEHFGGKIAYITHGNHEFVKFTLDTLLEKARCCGASIALYGHTHVPDTKFEDGIILLNPGSVADGKYAMVDILETGIMPILASI